MSNVGVVEVNETQAGQPSLYERLGGEEQISVLAREIFSNHSKNPLIMARYADSDPETVIRLVAELMCAGFGGPQKYTGKAMLAAHRGMNINEQEFIAVVDDVLDALAKHNVGQREKDEILCALYSMKAEIVHV